MKTNMIQEKQHHRERSDQVRKAMDETEEFHTKKMDPTFAQKLIQYRVARGWKRQDLARFLCMKENDIASIETGKAIHDGNTIHKIRMKLKI